MILLVSEAMVRYGLGYEAAMGLAPAPMASDGRRRVEVLVADGQPQAPVGVVMRLCKTCGESFESSWRRGQPRDYCRPECRPSWRGAYSPLAGTPVRKGA